MEQEYSWLVELCFGVFLLLAVTLVKNIAGYFFRKNKEGYHFSFFIEKKALLPIQVMIIGIGLYFIGLGALHKFSLSENIEGLNSYRNVFLIFCVAWFLIRWKNALHQHYYHTKSRPMHAESVRLLSRFATIGIVIIALMITLDSLGMDIAPLVAFGGVGAATLGFAAKDVFANFFGGVMLSLCRPFSIGDQVMLPEKNLEGLVEEIGWYLTRIRDKEKRCVYLPNSAFATIQVINGTRRSHRRIMETLQVRCEELFRILEIVTLIKSYLKNHTKVDKGENILVYFDQFAPYSLEIHVEFYLESLSQVEFCEVKQEVLSQIGILLQEKGIVMPLPKHEVVVLQEPS